MTLVVPEGRVHTVLGTSNMEAIMPICGTRTAALEKMGRVDILVCSAGTGAAHLLSREGNPSLVENIPVAAWDLTVDVNLKGVFLCNRAVLPHFKEQGKGKIINIASDAGRKGDKMLPVYGASKAGVINLSQAIALQCAEHHINVNTICPGLIWTRLWSAGVELMVKAIPEFQAVNPDDAFAILVDAITPFKRPQTADDIGNMVVFLASDLAKEITGQTFNVDGGVQMN
jgi:NAD(P)-dependent dehydrogenase (short-subunit alcohol dehydrogenase family)